MVTLSEKLHDERIADELRAAGLDPDHVARPGAPSRRTSAAAWT
jgi:hypothetical protein